jgi:hypothetical protein
VLPNHDGPGAPVYAAADAERWKMGVPKGAVVVGFDRADEMIRERGTRHELSLFVSFWARSEGFSAANTTVETER